MSSYAKNEPFRYSKEIQNLVLASLFITPCFDVAECGQDIPEYLTLLTPPPPPSSIGEYLALFF